MTTRLHRASPLPLAPANRGLWMASLVLGLAGPAALAQQTPVGLWKTIDDDGKTVTSLVRITETAGQLTGVVEKILDPEAKPGDVCEKCSDERKGKPILGLTILQKVTHSGDDASLWDGGEILDPKNGQTYRVRLSPQDGGKALAVRGYIGMPWIGRTQTWIRVE